ncbi:MAG: DNA polymerase III subunit delta [Oscillospiraceae bacterium]
MAYPKKPDSSAMKALKAQIRTQNIAQCYLFCGEEAYLRDFYLGEVKKALLPGGLEAFNLHTIDGKTCTPRALETAIDCLPMMCERTLVLVTDYDLMKAPADDKESIIALLADLPDYVCLIFLYDLIDYKPDARTKLSAALKDHVVNFARQEQSDLTDWIRRRFLALDHDIDTETARYFIFLCGDLMTTLASEIGKVGAYAKERRITKADIDGVATPLLDAVVFQLTDQIGRRNYDGAAAVLGDLLHMQEAPIMILSVLGKQLRQLYSARLALQAKKSPQYLVNLWKISPYPAEKLMASAQHLSVQWCRNAVRRAAETDLAMKSTGADGADLLISLLMELANG